MVRVILQRVPGLRVGEDRQAAAIDDKPRDDTCKLINPDRQLAAAARMRTNRAIMHAPDHNAERLVGCLAQASRPIVFCGIEIDMGVITRDRTHGNVIVRVPRAPEDLTLTRTAVP